MKKILTILLAVMLIASIAIPAHAATPSLKIPDVPQISKIKFDIKIELPDSFWDNYFKDVDWSSVFNKSDKEELTKWK